MVKQVSSLLLTLMITIALSACGGNKAAESTASPMPSPSVESVTASSIEAPSATPPASSEAAATPSATAVESSATPKAAQAATISPKPAATASPAATAKPTVKPTATPKAEESGAAAEALFKQSCTSCHGVDLEGGFGPDLQKVGHHLTKTQITTQITDGGTSMPPFGKRLKTEEIQTLAVWLAAKK